MSTENTCTHFDFVVLEMPDMRPLSTSVFFPSALPIEKNSASTMLTERARAVAQQAVKVGTYWENQNIGGLNCHIIVRIYNGQETATIRGKYGEISKDHYVAFLKEEFSDIFVGYSMLPLLQNGCHVWFGTDDLQKELNSLYWSMCSQSV